MIAEIGLAVVLVFAAPGWHDKVAVAKLVRKTAVRLGCLESSVMFEGGGGDSPWLGRVECRLWEEPPKK